jgi:hypothetical protein
MSSHAQPPFQQNFYPNGGMNYGYDNHDHDHLLSTIQNSGLNQTLNDGISKTMTGISGTNILLSSELNNVSKTVYDSTGRIVGAVENHSLGLRDAVERGNLLNSNATERTAATTQSAIERVAGEGRLTTVVSDAASRQAAADTARDIIRAVDRNGFDNMSTTERINSQISSAVDRNGSTNYNAIERTAGESRMTTVVADAASRQAAADTARDILRSVDRNGSDNISTTERINSQLGTAIERNGSLNLNAIERTTGEARITTVVTDAASRQAAADIARDLAVAIERNGANSINTTQLNTTTLLGSIERNAGENRTATLIASGQTDTKILDVRHSILNDMNRGTNEILNNVMNNSNVTNKMVGDSAWEMRNAFATHATANLVEMLKSDALLARQGSDNYSSLLLEQQKVKEYLASKGDTQFAIGQLEQQKAKEYISSKTDGHYASLLLEQQKVKSDLANQASTHFSINQLEQQKLKECLSLQLADAKYEALKSQNYLSDKIGECCCSVKEKMDNIDRDRLRDNLVSVNNDNSTLRAMEIAELVGGRRGGYGGGYDRRGDDRRR